MVVQMSDTGYIKQPSDFRAEQSIAGLYDLGETIGEGHFSVVREAKHVFTDEQVAVKVINKEKVPLNERESLLQEVRCMQMLDHPYIVRLLEVYDTPTKLYLVMELGDGGDLHDYIIRQTPRKGLPESVARRYFSQIVQAVTYCHQKHVVHRDLKPENVVVFRKQNICKLIDFGFGRKFEPGIPVTNACGSLSYSAPEMFLKDEYDPTLADVWSLGVILFWLVCGRSPFAGQNDSETLTRILDGKYKSPSRISPDCRNLIHQMLNKHPSDRATVKDILNHRWMTDEIGTCSTDSMSTICSMSPSDHAQIINQMVDGNVASKTEILQSLESHQYNHITATYFLLAGRKTPRTANQPADRSTPYDQDTKQQRYQQSLKNDPQPSILPALSTSDSNLGVGKSTQRVFSSIREESFGLTSRSSWEIHSLKCVSRSQSFSDVADHSDLLLASHSHNSVDPKSRDKATRRTTTGPFTTTSSASVVPDGRVKQTVSLRRNLLQLKEDTSEGDADSKRKTAAEDDEDELCSKTGICKIRRGFEVQRKPSRQADRFKTFPLEADESQLHHEDDEVVHDEHPLVNTDPVSKSPSLRESEESVKESTDNLEPVTSETDSVKRFETKVAPTSPESKEKQERRCCQERCSCCAVQ